MKWFGFWCAAFIVHDHSRHIWRSEKNSMCRIEKTHSTAVPQYWYSHKYNRSERKREREKRAQINRVVYAQFMLLSITLDEQNAFVDHNSNGEDVFYVRWSKFFVGCFCCCCCHHCCFAYYSLPLILFVSVPLAKKENYIESMLFSNVYCIHGEYAFSDTYFIANTSVTPFDIAEIYVNMFHHLAIFLNTPERQQKPGYHRMILCTCVSLHSSLSSRSDSLFDSWRYLAYYTLCFYFTFLSIH